MKTEQFDDEFRKKLLGLEPSDDEVDRIYNYVSSGGISSYSSWAKVLAYGLTSMLLVASLAFNYFQNLTNKELLSSLNALKARATSVGSYAAQKPILRVDTVYVNRYVEKPSVVGNQRESLYATQNPHIETKEKIDNMSADGSANNVNFTTADSTGTKPSEQATTTAKSIAQRNHAPGVDLNTSRSDNTAVKRSPSETNGDQYNPSDDTAYVIKDEITKSLRATKTYSFDKESPLNTAQFGESKNWLRPGISLLDNIDLSFVKLKLPVLKIPQKIPFAAQGKPKYYSESMKSVLKKMDYYIGGSLEAGNRQVAGSLLGELRISPKWSFQTGARWTEITGRSFDTAEQYDQQTGQDFRALYAPYVGQNVDLLNIEQNYQLVHIPLTIAYHHEIGSNWSLRFGIGTDLTAYFEKDINFDYKENSQSFNRGAYNAKLAVKPFNDITLNLGLERHWNKLLFRASPYISPQLRKTEFSNGGLLWGARLQVLYRLN